MKKPDKFFFYTLFRHAQFHSFLVFITSLSSREGLQTIPTQDLYIKLKWMCTVWHSSLCLFSGHLFRSSSFICSTFLSYVLLPVWPLYLFLLGHSKHENWYTQPRSRQFIGNPLEQMMQSSLEHKLPWKGSFLCNMDLIVCPTLSTTFFSTRIFSPEPQLFFYIPNPG